MRISKPALPSLKFTPPSSTYAVLDASIRPAYMESGIICLVAPAPVCYFGQIYAVLMYVLFVFDELIVHLLIQICSSVS